MAYILIKMCFWFSSWYEIMINQGLSSQSRWGTVHETTLVPRNSITNNWICCANYLVGEKIITAWIIHPCNASPPRVCAIFMFQDCDSNDQGLSTAWKQTRERVNAQEWSLALYFKLLLTFFHIKSWPNLNPKYTVSLVNRAYRTLVTIKKTNTLLVKIVHIQDLEQGSRTQMSCMGPVGHFTSRVVRKSTNISVNYYYFFNCVIIQTYQHRVQIFFCDWSFQRTAK